MRASTRYLFGACLPTNRPRRYGGGWNGFGSWGKSYAFKTSRRYRGGRAGVVGLVLMRGRAWRSVAASFVLHAACHVRRGRAGLRDSNEHCAAGSARVVSLSEPAVDWKLAEAACVGEVFLCPLLAERFGMCNVIAVQLRGSAEYSDLQSDEDPSMSPPRSIAYETVAPEGR